MPGGDARTVPGLVLDAVAVSPVPVTGDAAVRDNQEPAGIPESQRFRQ